MFYAKRIIGNLRGTFFDKCYICEANDILGEEEHRIPKSANISDENLQDETNLFWACKKCNGRKGYQFFKVSNECKYGNGYVGIIDCTKCDPNKYIKLKIRLNDCYKHKITISVKNDAPCVKLTICLLNKVYGSKNGMCDNDIDNLKLHIAQEIRDIDSIIDKLHCAVRHGQNEMVINSLKERIIILLLPNSPFSAFKLTFVEETYEKAPDSEFKNILSEILSNPQLHPNADDTCCS